MMGKKLDQTNAKAVWFNWTLVIGPKVPNNKTATAMADSSSLTNFIKWLLSSRLVSCVVTLLNTLFYLCRRYDPNR